MVVYSVWLPLLVQGVVPLILLWALTRAATTQLTFIAAATGVALYTLAIAGAGLWLVLPWYAPLGYGLIWLAVVAQDLAARSGAPALAHHCSGAGDRRRDRRGGYGLARHRHGDVERATAARDRFRSYDAGS